MADVKPCWVRTAHEQHGWTEVDGKVVSLVDASTVLTPPEGSKVGYHRCNGVPDLVEETRRTRYTRSDRDREVWTVSEVPFGNASIITERRIDLDAVYERVMIVEPWREVQRITCFCCTCGDPGNDPACRNHGFAAVRPCEEHGTPGSVWEDYSLDGETDPWAGTMPESVQEIRAKQREP